VTNLIVLPGRQLLFEFFWGQRAVGGVSLFGLLKFIVQAQNFSETLKKACLNACQMSLS